jgi:hypothetical protein
MTSHHSVGILRVLFYSSSLAMGYLLQSWLNRNHVIAPDNRCVVAFLNNEIHMLIVASEYTFVLLSTLQ